MQNVPWNRGRLTGQRRPLKPKDVWAIRVRLQLEHRARDLALFNLAIDSKLRGCDLVRLQVDDVCAGDRVRDRATVIQKKTGRPVQFEITEQTRASIRDWLPEVDARNGQYLFPSRFRALPHLSTRQNARIVHAWVESAGLDGSAYGKRTRYVGRRLPKSTRRRATCEPSNCSLGTRSSKARCGTSASRSMMRLASPSRSSCELSREGAAPRQAGPRRSAAWQLRTSTNDRYRRQNAPFMIIAVNHEVGWFWVIPDWPGR
jgi:Phage integrase family